MTLLNEVSKHDSNAYSGEMNRLVFSKVMAFLAEYCISSKEYIDKDNDTELVALLKRERNKTLDEMYDVIAEEHNDILSGRDDDWYWNEKNADQKP